MEQQQSNLDISQITKLICITGNDGTGKSSICQLINGEIRQSHPYIYCIERSFKSCPEEFKNIQRQIRQLDLITYNYSFQKQRKQFLKTNEIQFQLKDSNNIHYQHKIKVFWFILDLSPEKIQKRLLSRKIIDKYDCKKAVQYYSYIYRQFAYDYGMPIINVDRKLEIIVQEIVDYCTVSQQCYDEIISIQFNRISLEFISSHNIENIIYENIQNSQNNEKHIQKIFKNIVNNLSLSKIKQFYQLSQDFKIFLNQKYSNPSELRSKLISRWLIKNGSLKKQQNNQLNEAKVFIQYLSSQNSESVQKIQIKSQLLQKNKAFLHFKNYQEGQSKILLSIHSFHSKVQQYFKGKVIILLKSTIYSHTKQHTGQIPHLGKIRAVGNILFSQMLRRNNIKHAYLTISEQGIILSQLVQTNMLEVVFKKQLLGTDKHSFSYLKKNSQIINTDNCYTTGTYIRIDWRNPNHIFLPHEEICLNQDPYYYVIEKYYGKQQFFKLYLSDPRYVKAMGDKCITSDFLQSYAPINKVKRNALKLYTTFLYYSRKVGLQILDGCFMFDKTGQIGWSQINPDCMRVKSIKQKEDYDKDIWRYGGGSKKQDIIKKWTMFNNLFIQWFKQNRFHLTQVVELPDLHYPYQSICKEILSSNREITPFYQSFYRSLIRTRLNKKLIGTIDISNSQPILVKSSQISEIHSEGSLKKAWEYLSILDNVVLVDIDAAKVKGSDEKYNRSVISNLIKQNPTQIYAVGGGIRTKQILNQYLNESKVSRIILSSNLALLDLLTAQDIAKRVIVQLSINQHNEVLIKGRSENTKIKLAQRISELIEKNVKTISITFNHSQGHLNGIPRKQLIEVMCQIPYYISNIIIAGGITTLDDLEFIWGFPRCIPQLGSAIWKNKISLGEIYDAMTTYNNEGLLPAIIQDQFKNIIGQVYLNSEALKLSCSTRKLYRYSRQHQKVMKKGETSSNIFDILSMKFDCDNDSIIIKVKGENSNFKEFCHLNQYSCFDEKLNKNEMSSLQSHILQKKQTGSGYSKRMMENEGLAAMKIIEQIQQLHITQSNKIHESADLFSHLLMYLSAHNIKIDEVMNELDRRARETTKILQISPQKSSKVQDMKYEQKLIYKVGIISGKHFDRIDKISQQLLGIRIIRATNRSSKINYEIVNEKLYKDIFSNCSLELVGIKSKDMSTIICKSLVNYCINYSIMMENYPSVCQQISKIPTPGIILALLGRKNRKFNPKQWSPSNKGIIICQYPFSVNKYFKSISIPENHYTLIRVSGGTQSYLASQNCKADCCDAIVQSGKTVEENNLEIIEVLQRTIYAGYYKGL